MILFVCTGNTCRSPMAEALLRHHLGEGAELTVTSAGTLGWNAHPATPHAVTVMHELGIDLSRHVSRKVSRDDIEAADAVVAMTRKHAWAIAAYDPPALDRTFLFGELVRHLRASRPARGALRGWAHEHGARRAPGRPLGHAGDEIDDPAGESLDVYRATAHRLDRLARELASSLSQLTRAQS